MERVRDLAGTILDDNVAVLTDGAGLLRVGFGSTGVSLRLEVMLFVRHAFSLCPSIQTLSSRMKMKMKMKTLELVAYGILY